MLFISAKIPKIIKELFPNYIWDVRNENKTIYLTFDDGPIPDVTEFVLEQLKKYNAKATFFCIGDNIKKHPEIFKKIISDGHVIGNHTMNHIQAWGTNKELYLQNVMECENCIREYIDVDSIQKYFRPPYGQISVSKLGAVKKLGYKIVLWDTLSKDWEQTFSKENCLQNVIQHVESGSILVFHDSVKASKNLKYVLPEVLHYFSEREYTFDSI